MLTSKQMDSGAHAREVRIRALVVVAVTTNVLGNFALSRGMHEVGDIVSLSPLPYLHAFLNLWVVSGVCLLAIWIVSQLSLLSRADLSYVLPVTSTAYVLTAILGKVILDEHVSVYRWAGIGIICIGVIIVGRTAPRTTKPVVRVVHPPAVVYPPLEVEP